MNRLNKHVICIGGLKHWPPQNENTVELYQAIRVNVAGINGVEMLHKQLLQAFNKNPHIPLKILEEYEAKKRSERSKTIGMVIGGLGAGAAVAMLAWVGIPYAIPLLGKGVGAAAITSGLKTIGTLFGGGMLKGISVITVSTLACKYSRFF